MVRWVPSAGANGIDIFYELTGSGDPVVLVHGSWVDHNTWATVVPQLADSHTVVRYDRRGYSQTGTPEPPWTVHDEANDLGALIEALELAPAHVVTNSFGGNVAMRLVVKRPELIRTLAMHEPPVFDLLEDDPDSAALLEQNRRSIADVTARIEAGNPEGGARQFVEEVAFGPGVWEMLPPEMRDLFVRHAPTFANQTADPDELGADLEGLASLSKPTLLSHGTESPPLFPRAIDVLARTIPGAQRKVYEGAAHVPHFTHPDEVARTTRAFIASG